jgi:superfamily II helicase
MSKLNYTQAEQKNLDRDKKTVMAMAQIFCRGHNHICSPEDSLCPQCLSVVEYSNEKTQRCPYKHQGTCNTCPTQCYTQEMRLAIREIMAYSGPRMILHHPIMAIRYLIKKRKNK